MMPRSFLVRLRPAMESLSADSNTDMNEFDWKNRKRTITQPSDATSSRPVNATEHLTLGTQIPHSRTVTMAKHSSSLGNHLQSYPNIMQSLHKSQSNPALVMTSHHSNQSGISTGTSYHHVGPTFEIAMPQQYRRMPHYPSWCQYDCLPSNNTPWCYQPRITNLNNLQPTYPVERVLHNGEVSVPFYSKDKLLYRTHDCESAKQTFSDTKYAVSINKYFSVERKPGTRHPDKDHTANPTTTFESRPGKHTRSYHHVQKQIAYTNNQQDQNKGRNNGKQTNESSITDQTYIDNGTTVVTCETTPCDPDNVNTHLSSDSAENIRHFVKNQPSNDEPANIQYRLIAQPPSNNPDKIHYEFITQQSSVDSEQIRENVKIQPFSDNPEKIQDNLFGINPEKINHDLITQNDNPLMKQENWKTQQFSDYPEKVYHSLTTQPSIDNPEKVQHNTMTKSSSDNPGKMHYSLTAQLSSYPQKIQDNLNTPPLNDDPEKNQFDIIQPSSDNSDKMLSDTPAKVHNCKQCHKSFNRASNLRAHMKTHSEFKPYKCDYCGKGFHQKIDKRIHHYTHTGEKPHQCKKCGRGFKQLTHLNYHMRTHSDTHMYHCTYCGKGFNQKGNLQAHIYGHTGQRPFKCEICEKGFTLRSTLNTHLRTHAQKKPFVCEYCDKAFYQKNALKMHHIASHPLVNGKSIL